MPEYRVRIGDTGSFTANPHWPGARGYRQGWGPGIANNDFNGLFATNPEVVKRGIGLQPEAFRDFHFREGDWPYDEAWAEEVLARIQSAQDLVNAGKNAEAVAAYVKLAAQEPMEAALKAELLDRAAVWAGRLGDYAQAMELAKRIADLSTSRSPVNELSARRQMALMVKQDRYKELIEAFADRPGTGTPYLNWFVPDDERPLADALYCRSIAYAKTGDMEKAEKDARTMVDKGKRLTYSPGPTILDLSWKRLGDFYRDAVKDEARALECYGKVLGRTTVFHADRPMPKPVLSGASEVLAAATEAACAILRRQGRGDEARKWEQSFEKAQAEASAFLKQGKQAPTVHVRTNAEK